MRSGTKTCCAGSEKNPFSEIIRTKTNQNAYIRGMKLSTPSRRRFLLVFVVTFLGILVSSCQSDDRGEQFLRTFKQHRYDFSKVHWRTWEGLHYQLPDGFEVTDEPELRLYEKGIVYRVPQIGLYLIIDRIPREKTQLWIGSASPTRALEYVHAGVSELLTAKAFYLDYSTTYFLDNPRLTAIGQSVEGQRVRDRETVFYQLATLQKNGSYYAIQLVSNAELAAYLADDFQTFIQSIR